MIIQQATLYFKEGTSDKVYQTWVDKNELTQECSVKYAFGRRGANLRGGSKTDHPVSQWAATKIYNDLVESKVKKGYGYDYPI
jgi:predicted DNA-binding WGR domain protein